MDIEDFGKTGFKHNTKEIEVLDSIMGSGKTVGIIKWMNDNPNKRYIYISPLLSEVEERIPQECAGLEFVSPNTENDRTKSAHLLKLLKDGSNVSFTHSLFVEMTEEHLKFIDQNDYTMLIDEEIDFIESYDEKDYKPADIETLCDSGHIEIDHNNLGRVNWTWDENMFREGSRYSKMKRMCEMQMLYCTKNNRMIVVQLPISLIQVAERVIVMTYLFDGSIMSKFMEMKGVSTKHFNEVSLMKTEAQVKEEADRLIKIFTTPSVRKVSRLGLSAKWYNETASREDLKRVERAILSACRRGKCEDVMYTLPKERVEARKTSRNPNPKPSIDVKGYHPKNCYVSCRTKATNIYSHKTVLVHGFNRHPMVSVHGYLKDYNFPIERDEFALSECIQWVWRSAIRKGEPVQLCFLSKRMEDLFIDWLKNG